MNPRGISRWPCSAHALALFFGKRLSGQHADRLGGGREQKVGIKAIRKPYQSCQPKWKPAFLGALTYWATLWGCIHQRSSYTTPYTECFHCDTIMNAFYGYFQVPSFFSNKSYRKVLTSLPVLYQACPCATLPPHAESLWRRPCTTIHAFYLVSIFILETLLMQTEYEGTSMCLGSWCLN